MNSGRIENDLDPLQIGLVGCGRWGRWILRDLKTLGAHVHVLASSDQSRKNAKTYGADTLVSKICEFPSHLDGYVIASIATAHYDNILALKKRDKPIFVEKPISISVKEVEKLAGGPKDQIFVMHKWRYHQGIIKIKEYIDSKQLGEVLTISCRRNQWGSPHKDINTVWVHLPHDLSIILHLLEHIPMPQYAHLILDRNQETQGIHCMLKDKISCFIEHNACYATKDRNLNVHFENGAIQMNDPLSDHLVLRRGHPNDKSEIEKISISTEMPLLSELKAFLNYVKENDAPIYSNLQDEIKIISMIDRLLKMANHE